MLYNMLFYSESYATMLKEHLNVRDLILELETKTNKIIKLKISFKKIQNQLENQILLYLI